MTRRLMKYVGVRDGRPVYIGTTCENLSPRMLMKDTGLVYAGRRVFTSAECGTTAARALMKHLGRRDGREVYLGACCPVQSECPFVPEGRPDHLDWIADVDGTCCDFDGMSGALQFDSVLGGTAFYNNDASTPLVDCTLAIGSFSVHLTLTCTTSTEGEEAALALSTDHGLTDVCFLANPSNSLDFTADLISVQWNPFVAVFQFRIYENFGTCPCDDQLVTITLSEP